MTTGRSAIRRDWLRLAAISVAGGTITSGFAQCPACFCAVPESAEALAGHVKWHDGELVRNFTGFWAQPSTLSVVDAATGDQVATGEPAVAVATWRGDVLELACPRCVFRMYYLHGTDDRGLPHYCTEGGVIVFRFEGATWPVRP